MKKTALHTVLGVLVLTSMGLAQGAVTDIPQSALTPSTDYYTDRIGGGIGTALIMTGGGNAANVGGSPNDDGFSGPINLGFDSPLDFFGGSYTQFWANNNGNISFTGGISAFTPQGPQGATVPIISPYFGDVDTRNALSGLMYLRNDIPNQIIVTWDQVGYYNSHADHLNSFQLILRGPDYVIPAGEGAVGFFWKTMDWETGDASGGTGGFGGTEAAVGFGDGLANGIVLTGSTLAGISNVVENHNIWFTLDGGIPEPTCGTPNTPPCQAPEPETLPLLGAALALLAMARRRRRK